MRTRLALTVIAAVALLIAQQSVASAKGRSARRAGHVLAAQPSNGPLAAATGCDASLWKHVYNPTRLIKKQACTTVTGTIVDATNGKRTDGVRHEADGDTHGWLKLDPEFEKLLNAGNKSKEGGNMVFEVICKFPVTQADAVAACKSLKSKITIPAVGSHVAITGTLVLETKHAKWMEIHPVSSITVQ
jgi:hypothetical protein